MARNSTKVEVTRAGRSSRRMSAPPGANLGGRVRAIEAGATTGGGAQGTRRREGVGSRPAFYHTRPAKGVKSDWT